MSITQSYGEITQSYGDIEEIIDELEDLFVKLKKFDTLHSPPPDHHYLQQNKSFTNFCSNRRSQIANIIKEWEVLRQCLSDSSIYVRAYETRPDLMRAIIKGSPGTPYCDVLFCFDIRLPRNYPCQPPELFYHSYGCDVNPNLNGKINLTDSISKMEHPKRFRILDVLATIQVSILKGNLCSSNDGVVKTWEAMLRMLNSPPQNFEFFVQGHFRTQAHQILMNWKCYMGSDESMRRMFFRLVRAFEGNGTYCKHHYDKQSYDMALLEDVKCSITTTKRWLCWNMSSGASK